MSEVLHANIFFVIASVATVAFSILICIALYYIIKILVAVRAIVERVEAGSDVLAEDITAMRRFVRSGGLVAYLVNLVSPKRRASKRSKTAEDDEA